MFLDDRSGTKFFGTETSGSGLIYLHEFPECIRISGYREIYICRIARDPEEQVSDRSPYDEKAFSLECFFQKKRMREERVKLNELEHRINH